MTPHYLNTETEAVMWAALDAIGFVAEHDGERYITVEHSIIGVWYERTGGTDDAPVMEPIAGWHFNLLLAPEQTPADWADGINETSPETPWRVWG